MAKENPLAAVASEASEAPLVEVANVKLAFVGTTGWLDDAPGLGEHVKFEVSGFVRKSGKEFIEKDESEREFVQVKVTGLRQV